MLVVSDSSPLNFLIRLNCADLLPTLFGTVVIPPAVEHELNRPETPEVVRAFFSQRPAWLTTRVPMSAEPITNLDPGEVAAINLAREIHADAILLDDADARRAAALRGLKVIGLLGILERADVQSLIVLPDIAARLPADYRIDPALIEAALERRRQRGGSTR